MYDSKLIVHLKIILHCGLTMKLSEEELAEYQMCIENESKKRCSYDPD